MEAWREELYFQLNRNELYHHGIKGQKWGIRRYQNEDGTLTEEGKKRIARYQERETAALNRTYDKQIARSNARSDKYLSKYTSETNNKRRDKYLQKYGDNVYESQVNSRLKEAELKAIKNATLKSIKDERNAVLAGEALCVGASMSSIAGMMTGLLPMAFIVTANPAAIKTEQRISQDEAKRIAKEAHSEMNRLMEEGRKLVEGK